MSFSKLSSRSLSFSLSLDRQDAISETSNRNYSVARVCPEETIACFLSEETDSPLDDICHRRKAADFRMRRAAGGEGAGEGRFALNCIL